MLTRIVSRFGFKLFFKERKELLPSLTNNENFLLKMCLRCASKFWPRRFHRSLFLECNFSAVDANFEVHLSSALTDH